MPLRRLLCRGSRRADVLAISALEALQATVEQSEDPDLHSKMQWRAINHCDRLAATSCRSVLQTNQFSLVSTVAQPIRADFVRIPPGDLLGSDVLVVCADLVDSQPDEGLVIVSMMWRQKHLSLTERPLQAPR